MDRAPRTSSALLGLRAAVPWRVALVVVVVALIARLSLVLFAAPYSTPDTAVYETVANNIYKHFCVSRSDPATAACRPDWGGNQLPGYPTLIALSWWIGGPSAWSILVLQSALASLAVGWLTIAVFVYTRRVDFACAAGLLLAISPLQVGFSRTLLTEPTAIAATEWVFAELILSLAMRRLRLWPLGAALAAAIFIRYDAILLCLIAAWTAFHLHPMGAALRRGAALASIVAAPLALWTLRCVVAGLPYFPSTPVAGVTWPTPNHMLQWGMSWAVTSEQQFNFAFPILDGDYSDIRVPASIYVNDGERREVEQQLRTLSRLDGHPVPREIDDVFASLMAQRRGSHPVETFLVYPLKRAVAMWGDAYSSYGWPINFHPAEAFAIVHAVDRGGVDALIRAVLQYPFQAAGKVAVNGYKFMVFGIFAIAIIWRRSAALAEISEITLVAAAYALVRTAFFASGVVAYSEIRYLAEALPGLELVCALTIMFWIKARRTTA